MLYDGRNVNSMPKNLVDFWCDPIRADSLNGALWIGLSVSTELLESFHWLLTLVCPSDSPLGQWPKDFSPRPKFIGAFQTRTLRTIQWRFYRIKFPKLKIAYTGNPPDGIYRWFIAPERAYETIGGDCLESEVGTIELTAQWGIKIKK